MSYATKTRAANPHYVRERRSRYSAERRRRPGRLRPRYALARWSEPGSAPVWFADWLRVAACVAALCGLAPAANADEPAAKVNYEEHIKPIFRDNCFLCHNQNQAKSDLALDNYGAMLRGGASGAIIEPGDPDNSRLWLLVTHQDSPPMPPEKEKLPDATLALIKEWIAAGAPESAGSKVKLKKKTNLALASTGGSAKPDGPAAMPQGLVRQPVVHTALGAAATVMAASPWAPLAALGSEHQVLLYNTDSGQLLGVLPFPEGRPYVVKFSRNGSLLLVGGGRAGQAGKVVLFDVATGKRVTEIGDELDAVLAADINEDHTRVATGGPNRVVRVYNVEDGSVLHEIRKHTDWVLAVEFSPDGVLLASADRAGNMYLWEPDTAREYQTLKGHTAAINDLSWRDDSNILASASEDGTIRLWEMENGQQVKTWNAHGGAASVQFTHDGRLTSSGRDRVVQVWDQNGASQRAFEAFGDLAVKAVFTHDGARVIAGDWSGDVRLLNAADGARVAALPLNPPTLEMRVQQALAAAATASASVGEASSQLAAIEAAVAAKVAGGATAAAAAQAAAAEAKAAAERASAALAAAEQAAKDLAAVQQQVAELTARVQQLQAAAVQAQASAEQAAAEKAAYDASQNAQASAN